MTEEERANAKCYVAMRGENSAAAACVIDGTSAKMIRDFLNKCAGENIQCVTVAEARVLLSNYFWEKKQADPEPDQKTLAL